MERQRPPVPPNGDHRLGDQCPQAREQGVDCLTWGPTDLSFDIEAHPKHPFQTVDDCVKHVLEQLEGTDVRISFRNYSHELRQKYIDMGVTVLMERPKP